MYTRHGRARALCVGAGLCLVFAACDGTPRDPENRGAFQVATITTGRGAVYPYRIRQADSFGNPTSTVLNIESIGTLHANVSANNGVLPVASLSTLAQLPDGNAGNHFLQFTFSHKLDVDSILSNQLSNQTVSGLTGALNVVAYDPVTEQTTTMRGRGFVNGYTYFNEFGVLRKVQAVVANGTGVTIADSRAIGFPNYAGAADLVGKKTFTFVADTDDNLATIETFPTGVLFRLIVTNAVRDTDGRVLAHEICTATTVGDDPNPPQVLGYTAAPSIDPGNGVTGVDPQTSIMVRFNKPVQPGDVGQFFDPTNFTPAVGGITLSVTAAAQTYTILYSADPLGFGDLCNYRLTPSYNLPGQSVVRVDVRNTTIRSLNAQILGTAVSSAFTTGIGPGIVNAPVAPEAIYVGIGGADPGIAVIDLNGFGQGTGDINNTRFPLNPNIGQVGVTPPLAPGTSNVDAGSAGALTLARDTNLEFRLARAPVLGAIRDIHIGGPLDLVFNDENINVNTTRANQVNPVTNQVMSGNCISVAPHPNPPRLVFPPPNPNRQVFGEEPTTAGSAANLLTNGNPFTSRIGEIGIFGTLQNGVFNGPALPPTSPPPPVRFRPFNIRQQIGHFLYVLDSDNARIAVLNSNRMTLLDSIRMTDPVDMAVSPNMTRLAVANYSSSRITFVDINPLSSTFHQQVGETLTSGGPSSVAWQPDGEDVLAVSSSTNVLTIINAQDFQIRRAVSGFMNAPIDLAVTPRFINTGFQQGVYFAYVLNSNGTIAVYESGPDGVNGIGFNDMIGSVPNAVFPRAHAVRYDYTSGAGSIMIGHVDETGLGQISRLDMTASPTGPRPLNPNSGGFILPPTYRQKEWAVMQRIGGNVPTLPVHDLLSGNSIVDLCFDDLRNLGGALGQNTPFNAGLLMPPYGHSGKNALKGNATVLSARFLFVALSDVGQVDVVDINTGSRIASLMVPGVQTVASYFRQ